MCVCVCVFVCLLPLPRVINGVDFGAYIFYIRKRRALSSFWLISSSSDTTSKAYSSQDENHNIQTIACRTLCSSCTYCFFYYFLLVFSFIYFYLSFLLSYFFISIVVSLLFISLQGNLVTWPAVDTTSVTIVSGFHVETWTKKQQKASKQQQEEKARFYNFVLLVSSVPFTLYDLCCGYYIRECT